MNLSKRKNPRDVRARVDESLPTKTEIHGVSRRESAEPAVHPAYDGPTKGDTESTTEPTRGARGDSPAKEEFTRPRTPRPAEPQDLDLPPMRQSGEMSETEPTAPAYVRMRVLVEGDTLRILDSHLVDGPLREGDTFPGHYAYDVTHGGALLHAGPAPDLGQQRSFIAPGAPDEERTHHVTEVDRAIFTVRVPAETLTAAALPEIEVALYRLKEEAAGNAAHEGLAARYPQAARPVASRTGLPRSVLPAEIRRRSAR